MEYQNNNHNFRNKFSASSKDYYIFAVKLEFTVNSEQQQVEVLQALDALRLPHFNVSEILGCKTIEDVDSETDLLFQQGL